MVMIDLPRLVASRESARQLVKAAPGPLRNERVIVNSRELRSATSSFVDELVKAVLREGAASELVVLGGSAEFLEQIHVAGSILGVEGRISDRPAGSELDA